MRKAPLPASKVTTMEKPEVEGSWQQLPDWPAPDASAKRLWLRADGTLGPVAGAQATKDYVVNPYDGRAKYWGTPQSNDPYPDQQQVEKARAGWQLPPLSRDLVVAGDIRARIRAVAQRQRHQLRGAGARCRAGRRGDPGHQWLAPGQPPARPRVARGRSSPAPAYDFDVDVWPTHWRFKKGHSIRVSISGGDVPRIEPDAPAGTVDVVQGASYLELDLRR